MSEPQTGTPTPDPTPYGLSLRDGRPRTSRYYAVIGDPPRCGPGDFACALTYLHKIEAALVQGGWTAYEANRLQKLQVRWTRFAFGRDPRFNLVGIRDGRLKADVEYDLRPKQKRARADEARRSKRQIQDQRRNPERKWVKDVDADLPSGKAKGARNSMDPDVDVFEPEPGDVALPNIAPARQYLIPGQDTKGHAHRVYCRVMPAHYRALCALERSKAFGFRTVGDTIRWCIDYGVRELSMRANVPQSMSALAQVDAIREVLLDEQYYLEFPQMFELMTTTINRHLSAGAEGEAVRLIAIVRNQIEQMAEPYWREKFMAELMRHYGNYIDGSRAASADFSGEGGA